MLPCRQLDDVVPFYAALGFEQTYRQERPNPYLCLNRGGIDLHFFGLADFDPANSLGNVGVLVPDTGALYDEAVSPWLTPAETGSGSARPATPRPRPPRTATPTVGAGPEPAGWIG